MNQKKKHYLKPMSARIFICNHFCFFAYTIVLWKCYAWIFDGERYFAIHSKCPQSVKLNSSVKSHTGKCGHRVQPNALWTLLRNTFEFFSFMFSRVQRPLTLNICYWCTGFTTGVLASFHWLNFAYFSFTRFPWLQ